MTRLPQFLDPFTVDEFMRDHWGRRMLLIPRNDPEYFSEVLSMSELDKIVTSIRIPASNFNLAQNNDPLPLKAYCTEGDYVSKRRALSLHEQGATIILRSLEQWSPSLNRLRVEAETLFGCEAQVNVYLTPASEKSTPPHWDTHDLIVLQVFGSKRWRIFRGNTTNPLPNERFRVGVDEFDENYEEIVLHPGDTLYLPRGVIHEPIAESYSVHVSLGLHAHRMLDLVKAALDLAAGREGNDLRELFSEDQIPGFALTDTLGKDELEVAAEELRRRFAAGRAVDLEGRLREIQVGPTLDPAAKYSWRRGLNVKVQALEGRVRIDVDEEHVVLPASIADAVHCSLRQSIFSPESLPRTVPLEDRQAMCIALWQISAVRREETPVDGRASPAQLVKLQRSDGVA